MTTTAHTQDTALIRLLLGPRLNGHTWADEARGPREPAPGAALPRNPDDPRLRLRLFIGGSLADETWLDVTDPDSQRLADLTGLVHSEGVDAAREYEVPWLIEVYDPAEPEEVAYTRVGSDTAGMVAPVALTAVNGAVN